jgi:hypothetical protein
VPRAGIEPAQEAMYYFLQRKPFSQFELSFKFIFLPVTILLAFLFSSGHHSSSKSAWSMLLHPYGLGKKIYIPTLYL